MSVYAAMSAAVSGMKAQSKSLGNISDNLANSQTVGFKRVDTSFSDMVTSSNRRNHSPGGVIATPRYRHSVQGDLTQTQIGTNMAIAGNGFFVVSKANTVTPQSVSFDNNNLFTRRGDFQLDKFGYMVNGAGYYLNGREVIDQDTLNTTAIPNPIRIQADVMQAEATKKVTYSANLPDNAPAATNPYTSIAMSGNQLTFSEAGVGGFNTGDTIRVTLDGNAYEVPYGADMDATLGALQALVVADYPLATFTPGDAFIDLGAAATLTDDTVIAGDATLLQMAAASLSDSDETFYASTASFSGGATTVFNDSGTPTDVQFRWIRREDDGAGLPQWTLMYQDPNQDSWFIADTLSFGATRAAIAPSTTMMIGPTAAQEISISFTGLEDTGTGTSENLLTSYYAESISVYRNEQDGFQAGILSDVFINDYGYVVANYDNGRSRVLFQVPLATFNSPDEMERLDGGAYNRTPESGDPLITEMGVGGSGSIISSATENSNVDIADEFIKMIVAQRAYSANSRSVTTADDMLQETLNLKR